MSLQVSQRPLSPNTLERELVRIRDTLTLKENEDSWDTISKGIQALNAVVQRGAASIPQDITLALRSLAHPVNAAVLSERSRLSAAAVELLTTAATELGSGFDSLLPIFFPTLLNLCTRLNKVFVSRARTCIMVVIRSTQSPIIISYLCRSMKEKSNTLRPIIAECALVCLNSFNPPDLQKEARSREIELLIKWAATDPSAEVRKYGRHMYEAYQILLPERVESFTAPLSPTVRKYLNIATKHRSQPSQSSNPSSSRPASSLSVRSGLGSSTSSTTSSQSALSMAQALSENPTVPLGSSASSVLGGSSSSTQSTTSQTSRYRILRSRSRTDVASSNDSSHQKQTVAPNPTMPPPDYIPSHSQRNLTSQAPQRPTSMHDSTNANNPVSQRQKVGPIRPSQYPPATQQVQMINETIAVKRLAGPRRVPLPEPPPPKETAQEEQREAKGPVRPASVCEPQESRTEKSKTHASVPTTKRTDVAKTRPPNIRSVASHANLKPTEHKPRDRSDSRNGVQLASRSKQSAHPQPSKSLDSEKSKGKDPPKPKATLPATKVTHSRQAAPTKVPELGHVTRRPTKVKEPAAKREIVVPVKVEPAALIPLPPSPVEPSTPTNTSLPLPELPITILDTQKERTEEASLPDVSYDTVTPKAAPSAIPAFMVEQTPITALVDSIRAGFVFSPGGADSTFDDDDDGECERTFVAGEPRYLKTLPLSWGPLVTKSQGGDKGKLHSG